MAGWTCPDRNDIEWDGIISATKGFNTSGNVGIGTASPVGPLQIATPDVANVDALIISRGTSASGALKIQSLGGSGTGYPFLIGTTRWMTVYPAVGGFGLGDVGFGPVGASPNVFFDSSTGNVGIGTASPSASTLLDLTSTTGAFLPPRMTTTQRDALTAINGMIIYNSTTDALNYYKAGIWTAI